MRAGSACVEGAGMPSCAVGRSQPAAQSPKVCAGIVFDETHFGRFTNQYTRGEYFFDMYVGAAHAS